MTHEDVWRAIERFADEHGMSCSGLARCSGLVPRRATTLAVNQQYFKNIVVNGGKYCRFY